MATVLEYKYFVDTRLIQPTVRYVPVIQGPENSREWYIPAQQTGPNINSLSWNINFPVNQILDPYVRLRYYLDIDFNSDGLSPLTLQLGTNDGFSALPINSTISNYSITLNGVNVSTLPSDYVLPLLHYIGNKDRERMFPGSPILPDQFQEYSDRLALGSERNVFSRYGSQTSDGFRPRGQQSIVITANNPGFAAITATIEEPIMCLPFSWMDDPNREGLAGLQTMQIQIQINLARLARMWRHDAVNGAVFTTTPIIRFSQPPQLIYTLYTVPNILPIPNLSMSYTYPYSTIQTESQVFNESIGFNATRIQTLRSIQVGIIPNRFYIWIQENRNNQTFATSDFFARIDSIQVQIGNDTDVLSTADIVDLYRVSKGNGLQMTLEQFRRFQGSVVCLQNGKDIAFPSDDLAVGVPASIQYTFTIQFTNVNQNRVGLISYEIFIAYTTPGIITFQNNAGIIQLGIVDSSQVTALKQAGEDVSWDIFERSIPYGGDFWDNPWQTTKQAASKAKDYISEGAKNLWGDVKSGVSKTWGKVKEGVGKVKDFFWAPTTYDPKIKKQAEDAKSFEQKLAQINIPPLLPRRSQPVPVTAPVPLTPTERALLRLPQNQTASDINLLVDRYQMSNNDQKILASMPATATLNDLLSSNLSDQGYIQAEQAAERAAQIARMTPAEIKSQGGLNKVIDRARPYMSLDTNLNTVRNATTGIGTALGATIPGGLASKAVTGILGAITGRVVGSNIKDTIQKRHDTYTDVVRIPIPLPGSDIPENKYDTGLTPAEIRAERKANINDLAEIDAYNMAREAEFQADLNRYVRPSTLSPGYTSSSMSSSVTPSVVSVPTIDHSTLGTTPSTAPSTSTTSTIDPFFAPSVSRQTLIDTAVAGPPVLPPHLAHLAHSRPKLSQPRPYEPKSKRHQAPVITTTTTTTPSLTTVPVVEHATLGTTPTTVPETVLEQKIGQGGSWGDDIDSGMPRYIGQSQNAYIREKQYGIRPIFNLFRKRIPSPTSGGWIDPRIRYGYVGAGVNTNRNRIRGGALTLTNWKGLAQTGPQSLIM